MIFAGIFGEIKPPKPLEQGYGALFVSGKPGLAGFLSNLFKLAALGAGLYSVINFILAGYGIITAEGEPEKIAKASAKIWYSLLGLTVIVCSFALAALLGWLLFKDANAILNLTIYGPKI